MLCRIPALNSSWATPWATRAPTSSPAVSRRWCPAALPLFKHRFREPAPPSRPFSGSAVPPSGWWAVRAARPATARSPRCPPTECKPWLTSPVWSADKSRPWWPTPPISGPPRGPPVRELQEQGCFKARSWPTARSSGNSDGPYPATRWRAICTSTERTSSSPPRREAC